MFSNKKRIGLCMLMAVITVIAMAVSACSFKEEQNPAEESSHISQDEQRLPQDEVPPPVLPNLKADPTPVVKDINGSYGIYIYMPQNNRYEYTKIAADKSLSILDMAKKIGDTLKIEPVLVNFLLERGTVTLDWYAGFIDSMPDEKTEQIFLNSVCVTIQQNLPQAENFIMKKEGGPYSSAFTSMEKDQIYEFNPLLLGEDTQEYYASIRTGITYPGMEKTAGEFIDDINPQTAPIMELLVWIGIPEKEFASPKEISNELAIKTALANIPIYTSTYAPNDIYYDETLLAITAAVKSENVVLGEHVVAAAKELFGEDVNIVNTSVEDWVWHEKQGVYTPPNMGRPNSYLPVIFARLDNAETVTLEVSYIWCGLDGYYNPETMDYIEDSDVVKVAKTLPRYDVTLIKNSDETYSMYSHMPAAGALNQNK